MNLKTKILTLILIVTIGILIAQKVSLGQSLDFDVSKGKLLIFQEFLGNKEDVLLLKFTYSANNSTQYKKFFALAQKAKNDLWQGGWHKVDSSRINDKPEFTVNLTAILNGKITGIYFIHNKYHLKINRYDINFLEKLKDFLKSIKKNYHNTSSRPIDKKQN